MKKFICVTVAVLLAVTVLPFASAAEDGGLHFREDGSFTVIQLSDTQDDEYPARKLHDYLETAIKEADPDLIVFTGDLVEDSRIGDPFIDGHPAEEGVVVKKLNGDMDMEKTLANIKTATDAVLSVFEESGVPYVLAMGNNDYKCGIGGKEWLDILSEYPGCLNTDMSDDPDDRLDCVLPVYGKDGKTAFNLWITDTGKGGVNERQIEWYTNTSAAVTAENGSPVPSMVFQHIPVAETGNLFEECSVFDAGAVLIDGKAYRLKEGCRGSVVTGMTPGGTSAQFAAWQSCGDVIGAYFGHIHVDGYTGTYNGIELGLTYGSEFCKPSPYGYRLITLNENDILNYANDIYTYDNGAFELQTDEKEAQPGTFAAVLAAIRNFFLVFGRLFRSLLS